MGQRSSTLTACNRTDDQKRFRPLRNSFGQRSVRQLVRQILFTREEPQERSALRGVLIANRPAQHRIGILECIQDAALRNLPRDDEHHFAINASEIPQMPREYYPDHVSV